MAAQFAVGYGGGSPGDVGGAPTKIIKNFMQRRVGQGVFSAWLQANMDLHPFLPTGAWNATAIEKGVKYGYFKKSILLGVEFHEWTIVPKSSW
jgi:hypothetical protein